MDLASIPGFLHLQLLITCTMQKRREKAWGISSHDPWHDCHMSSHILSTAKLCTRLILHPVLTTKMGQVPAESCTEWKIPRLKAITLKGCWVTSMKIPSSNAIISWCKKRQHYLEFHHLYHSHPSAVKLWTWILFTGRTYLSFGTCFGSLASL